MNTIKRILNDIIIDDEGSLWKIFLKDGEHVIEKNFTTFLYYIENNVLYAMYGETESERSRYNPIRQLSSDEVIDYLHLIL